MKKIHKILVTALVLFGLPIAVWAVVGPLNQGSTGLGTSTKGELLVGTSSPVQYTRLAVGSNGQCLTASSTSPSGLAWASCAAGGSVTGTGINGFAAIWNSSSGLTTGTLRDNSTVSGVNATSSTVTFNIQGSGALNPLNVASSTGTSLVVVTPAGNVGIGTTTPSQQLVLTGSIQGPLFTDTAKYFYRSKSSQEYNVMRFEGPDRGFEVQMSASSAPIAVFKLALTDNPRTFSNVLQEWSATRSDQVVNATGTSLALWVRNGVNGTQETDRRFQVKTNFASPAGGGAGIVLGDGSGVGNANLYWGGGDILKTDDALTVVGTSTLATTTISNLTVAQAPTVSAFGAGVVHSSSGGLLSSSAIVNADIQNATIDLTAKVTGVLPIANGGTATTSSPTLAGQLLGAHTSGGWGVVNLIAGSNITITTSTLGQITIAASGSGGSGNSAFTIGNGLIYNATSTDLVGIGTITPTTTLFIQGKGGTNPFIIASSTGTAMLTMTQGGAITSISSYTGTSFNSGLGAAEVFPGVTTLTQGDILYASAANTYSALAKDTSSTRYLSNTGASNNPAWAQIDLSNGVTGVLPAANGGMGTTTLGDLLVGTNLSVSGGQRVLIGTTTTISLGTNVVTAVTTSTSGTVFTGSISANNLALVFPASPTFTNLTTTNASTTNLSVATNAYLTGIASGNCLQTGTGGLITSAGAACGTGGGSGNSAFTIGNGVIYNATSTDLVGIGTSAPTTTLFIQGKGGTNPLVVASSTGTSLAQLDSLGRLTIGRNDFASLSSVARPGTSDKLVMMNDTGSFSDMAFKTANDGNAVIRFDSFGGTLTSVATSAPANTLATFTFRGMASATTLTPAANIRVKIDGTPNGTNVPGVIQFDTASLTQSATTRMVINGVGNVGVNTATPGSLLSVQGYAGSTSPLFTVASSSNSAIVTVTSNGNVGIASSSPVATLAVVGNIFQNGNYVHLGTAASPFPCASNACMDFVGTDNTTGGVGISPINLSNGASAFGYLTLNNNLVNSSYTSGIFGLTYNSSGYNDTSFGSAFNSPNLGALLSLDGPISIVVASSSTSSFFSVFTGGTATSTTANGNERMRITSTGLVGIGTTSPIGLLTVRGNSTIPTTPLFVVASSSGSSILTVIATTTAPSLVINGAGTQSTLFVIASSSGTSMISVDNKGHISSAGTIPTTNSGSVVTGSTNTRGRTIPAAAATTATITFAEGGFGTTPYCTVTQEAGTAIVFTASPTPTTLVLTGTTIGSDSFAWICFK